MDCDFCSQNIPAILSHICEVVYNQFLREAGVPGWKLTILGLQAPEVTVSVTDPNGRMLTETITFTLDTQQEIHDLLRRSHDEWQFFTKEVGRAGFAGESGAGKT